MAVPQKVSAQSTQKVQYPKYVSSLRRRVYDHMRAQRPEAAFFSQLHAAEKLINRADNSRYKNIRAKINYHAEEFLHSALNSQEPILDCIANLRLSEFYKDGRSLEKAHSFAMDAAKVVLKSEKPLPRMLVSSVENFLLEIAGQMQDAKVDDGTKYMYSIYANEAKEAFLRLRALRNPVKANIGLAQFYLKSNAKESLSCAVAAANALLGSNRSKGDGKIRGKVAGTLIDATDAARKEGQPAQLVKEAEKLLKLFQN